MFQLNLNIKKLAVWLIPIWLRNSLFILIINASVQPLKQLYNNYVALVKTTLYRLQHNGQICYLQAVLNDKLDNEQRRIFISNFTSIAALYVWAETDLRDINFENTIYIYTFSMYGDGGVDFIVNKPSSVANNTNELAFLKSVVDEYKLASKKYIINDF